MRIAAIIFALLASLIVLGHVSGNQPERDAVAAASEELEIEFERRMIDVGEVTLHVVFAGPEKGKPVVLLHGFPEFWYAWRGPAAVLARAGHRVIIPDQRGYNRSDKPGGAEAYALRNLVGDLVGLIDALDYEQVAIGAQDWGSAVAWRTVIEHPERVSRFAVIDGGHPLTYQADPNDDEEKISFYRTFLQIPGLPGYTARLGNWALLANSLRDTSAEGAFPDHELDQLRSAWDRDGAIHSMANWYRAPFWPLEGEGRVSTPTLMILAANDAFIPASSARRSLDYLDGGELLELGYGSHWVSAEEPELIGTILAKYFAR